MVSDTQHKTGGNSALPPVLRLSSINKRFGAVHANKDVSLEVSAGTVHGIVGENGAGKSTLVSILYAFYTADSKNQLCNCLLYTSPSPRDRTRSRMPSSA